MPRRNGSYFGLTVNPTPLVASGIWRVREAEEFLRVNKWPATPGVPGSPVASAGNAQVSLAWSAPALGSPPTDYQVQYSSNSGSTWTTFADGTSTATSAVVTGLTNGTGYIFRVRAVNALGDGPYGAASGVVTPLALDVVLLMHFDGSNGSTTFTDSSPNGLTVTASGGAQVSTAQSKFGGASLYVDGNSAAIVDNSTALDLAGGDFTIEFWIHPSSLPVFVLGYGDAASVAGSAISFHSQGSWDFYYDGSSSLSLTPPALSVGVWKHIAVVRTGSDVILFVDGQETDREVIGAGVINSVSSALSIGRYAFGGLDGFIDEFRIVKNAVYTANFTPPTAPF